MRPGAPVVRWAILALALLGAATAGRAECVMRRMPPLVTTLENGAALIPVEIDGHPTHLQVDSGAADSVLSAVAAARFGLKVYPRNDINLQAIGGDVPVDVGVAKTFTLAGVPLKNVKFLVGAADRGADLAGLLGQNVLHLADVEYDLANGVVRLIQVKGCLDRVLAYWAVGLPISALDLEEGDNSRLEFTSIGEVTVNGVTLRALFDTGAIASSLTLAAAHRLGIDEAKADYVGKTMGAGGVAVRTWSVPIASVRIGGEEIRDTTLEIIDRTRDSVEQGDERVDVLIGADFFFSHHVFVANSQHKLYFTYNGGPVFDRGDHVVITDKRVGP